MKTKEKTETKKNLCLEVRRVRKAVVADTMCSELTTTSDTVQQM